MKVTPTRCVALIKPDSVEDKTSGGIILPDTVKERQQSAIDRGILIATGEGFFEDYRGPKPKIGDRVIYGRYSGSLITITDEDGKRVEHRLCNDDNIVAIIEG